MSKNNNGGYIAFGACAIPADPNSTAPSSVAILGRAVKGLFTHKQARAGVAATAVEVR